jgi:hypothetical protein
VSASFLGYEMHEDKPAMYLEMIFSGSHLSVHFFCSFLLASGDVKEPTSIPVVLLLSSSVLIALKSQVHYFDIQSKGKSSFVGEFYIK